MQLSSLATVFGILVVGALILLPVFVYLDKQAKADALIHSSALSDKLMRLDEVSLSGLSNEPRIGNHYEIADPFVFVDYPASEGGYSGPTYYMFSTTDQRALNVYYTKKSDEMGLHRLCSKSV
jgi:hypothetical protein